MSGNRWLVRIAGIVALAGAAGWCAAWPNFPAALDPAYHLVVARQVRDAGGPITYEWGESAPVGRPHLYPPLLHLLLAGLLRAGLAPINALRLMTLVLVPGVLLAMWIALRRITGRRLACAAVTLAFAPALWLGHLSQALAASLGLIELLLMIEAVHRRRALAASGLLGLLCYTHLGLPWVAVAMLLFGAALRVIPWRFAARAAGGGLLIGSPWLIHVARHLDRVRLIGRNENQLVDVIPALLLFAAIEVWGCVRHRGRRRLFLAAWLGGTAIAWPFLFRWASGEGALPMVVLAAGGLERVSRWIAGRRRVASVGTVMAALALVTMTGPSVRRDERGVSVRLADTGLARAVRGTLVGPPIYGADVEELAGEVARVSRPEEILWSNAPYAGGLVAGLAHRATSSAMLYEVATPGAFDPVAAAQWIVWFKIDPLPGTPTLDSLRRRYPLVPVAEQALAVVLHNPTASQLARGPVARIPSWMAGVLLWAILGIVWWDLSRALGTNPSRRLLAVQES